jgi:hypothetical protein
LDSPLKNMSSRLQFSHHLPSLEVNLIRIGLRRGRDCPALRQQFQFQ